MSLFVFSSNMGCLVPQVRAPSYNVRGFHFSGFWALTWAEGFRKPSENLELLGNPRLARLRLRGTWAPSKTFNNPTCQRWLAIFWLGYTGRGTVPQVAPPK